MSTDTNPMTDEPTTTTDDSIDTDTGTGSAAEQPSASAQMVLDVDPAFRELLQREADRHGFDSVEECAKTWLWVDITKKLSERHDLRCDVEIDVPREVYEAAALMRDVSHAEGGDVTLTEIFLNYFVEFEPRFGITPEIEVGGSDGD